MRKGKKIKCFGDKFHVGPFHVFNPVPTNHEEAVEHGNALAASGNYPVGTSDCFNVGISGGCGPECFVYQDGRCKIADELIDIENISKYNMTAYQIHEHYQIYPEKEADHAG